MCECDELSDWSFEVFGRGVIILRGSGECVWKNVFMGVRSLERSLRLAINHRSRFLYEYIGICVISL